MPVFPPWTLLRPNFSGPSMPPPAPTTSELADEFLAAGDRLPQAEHRKYWTRVRGRRGREWTEGDEIVFERFRVVWPPGLADPA
jgi:hypothetical protein